MTPSSPHQPRGLSRRELLKSGIAASALAVTAGSGLTEPAFAQAPKRGGTLRLAFVGSPVKIDPHTLTGAEEAVICRNAYDSLVFTDHTLTPRPELATHWETTPDSRVWVFHLRRGVRFHHGREMDADDVVWSYKRILDPATASPARAPFSVIQTVEKLDRYVVRFTLSGPFAEFPHLVGGNFQGRIAPRDVSDLNKNPSGTGPFKVTEFVPGDHVSFVRNDAYWKSGQPYLDQLRFVYLPEEASHVAALTAGSIEMSWWPLPEILPIYEANKDIQVSFAETYGYQPIVMAVDQAPFDKVEVRKAFRLICDREALTRVVLGNVKVPVSNDHPIPPFSSMYMAQTPSRQNIDEAKKLLADAGYKDGMDIEMMAWTGRAGLVQAALAFQDMAKKANVRISVKTVPADIFLSKFWLKHNFYVTNWNGRTTLYEMLSLAYLSDAKWNESHWKPKKMDELIQGIRSEPEETRRKALFAEIQKAFLDESPVIIPYHRPRITAVRKNVKGFQAHPTALEDLRTVWLG
jgi:peptide/nickel transport system substrate-binding protein